MNLAYASDEQDTPETIKDELRRLVTNLLMSIQHAGSVRTGGVRRIFAHVMVIIWGAMADHVDIFPASYGPPSQIQEMLLNNVNAAWAGKVVMTPDDMDTAADLIAGGPLSGKYVEELRQDP